MKNAEQIYVDFHVIQTVPPSCVNRDDTGSPKTAVYGVVTRARVSSQAWKRAIRLMFRDAFTQDEVGVRTKMVVDMIAEEISRLQPEAKAEKLAVAVLTAAGVKVKDNKGKQETGALFFISRKQVEALAALAAEHPDGKLEKAECQAALKQEPAVDIALFGRMVADDPSLNFDAAAQVAHAISTHAVHNEYDYFTAVDDCAPEDNAGAGHLGTVEYNSATLYRYATVNLTELAKGLQGDTAKALRGFADAFVRSMPTGKQNTFANRTRPDAVYVAIRRDQPVNMAGAFEKPVRTGREGYVEASEQAFVRYAQESYKDYVAAPETAFAVGEAMEPLAVPVSLTHLLDALKAWAEGHTAGEVAQ